MGHRVVKAGEDCLHQRLGFGARNQDGWCDFKFQAVELLRPENVLDWLESQPALDDALNVGELLARERAFRMGDQCDAVQTERVHQQDGCVGHGGGAQVGMRGELAGGSGQGFPYVDQR